MASIADAAAPPEFAATARPRAIGADLRSEGSSVAFESAAESDVDEELGANAMPPLGRSATSVVATSDFIRRSELDELLGEAVGAMARDATAHAVDMQASLSQSLTVTLRSEMESAVRASTADATLVVQERLAARIDATRDDCSQQTSAAIAAVDLQLSELRAGLSTLKAAIDTVRADGVETHQSTVTGVSGCVRRLLRLERIVTPVLGTAAGGSEATTRDGAALPTTTTSDTAGSSLMRSPQHGGRAGLPSSASFDDATAAAGDTTPGTITATTPPRWPPSATGTAAAGVRLAPAAADDDGDGDGAATAAPPLRGVAFDDDDVHADHVHGDSAQIARWPQAFCDGLRRVAAEVAREQIVLDKANNAGVGGSSGSGVLSPLQDRSGRFGGGFDEAAVAAIARDECAKAMDDVRVELRDDVSAIAANATRVDERLRVDFGAEIDHVAKSLQGALDGATTHFMMRLDQQKASRDDLSEHRSDTNRAIASALQQCTDLIENTRATLMRRLTASVPSGAALYGSAADVAATVAAGGRSIDDTAATTTSSSSASTGVAVRTAASSSAAAVAVHHHHHQHSSSEQRYTSSSSSTRHAAEVAREVEF